MVFGDVLGRVGGKRRRLVFYNTDSSDKTDSKDSCERVVDYVGAHDVDIEYVDDASEPDSTVAIHDGETRLASDDIEQVAAYIDGWETDLSADQSPPSIFEALDETIFRSTNKRQLVLASRLVETRALRAGEGRLAAGFQQLSLARPQLSFYKSLPEPIAVSLYGEPDWLPPADSGLTVYDPNDPNHATYWWVVFDGTDTPNQHAALLAEQTDDGSYTGFWTYRTSLVEEIREAVDSLDATKIAGP